MTLDLSTVKKIAEQCGFDIEKDTLCKFDGWTEPMMKFAQSCYAMGAQEQKEKDAKICDNMADAETFGKTSNYSGELTDAGVNYSECAESIRGAI